ncbi:hypothetical protein MNAN1_002127 [Malassezia nana]|uniref:FHA domain-containing protein n=1 Tax=Malassezia nana TaxID=180528 RepID=A0AAF0ELQ4_9BASI|nr:hypothetical protein MNAN1_002127 [Malassezia nana]
MWLLASHFAGEQGASKELIVEPLSERVLHTDRSYTLGRKQGAVDLLVPVARISRLSGTLTIGALHDRDVADPTVRPSVTWTMHATSKAGNLIEGMRGRNRFQQRVRPDTPMPLHDGDTLCLVPGITATLRWQPITVCMVRVPTLDTPAVRAAAARVGLHLVPPAQLAASSQVCVPSVRPNKTQLLALVHGLPLVSEAFVQSLLDLPSGAPWTPPDPSAFLPPSDPRLPPDAYIPRAQLHPDERRRHLFQGHALFLVVAGSTRRSMDMIKLAQAAGADVHVHDATVHALNDAQAALRALSQIHTEHSLHVMVADDATSLATCVRSAAMRLGLKFLPEGLAAITSSLLNVQRWDSMVLAAEAGSEEPVDVSCESDAPAAMDVTSDGHAEPLAHDAPSLAPEHEALHDPVTRPPPRKRVVRITAADLLPDVPAAPAEPPTTTAEQTVPTEPVALSVPLAESHEPVKAAAGGNDSQTLPRRAHTRQARRSHLIDDLLGVDDKPDPPPLGQANYRAPAAPPAETADKISSSCAAAAPVMEPLVRTSLMQVRVVPMVRRSRLAREARHTTRRRPSRRIALVLEDYSTGRLFP